MNDWLAGVGTTAASRRTVALLGAAFIAVIVGLAVIDIVRGHRAALDATGRDLDAQARVLAEQAARSTQAIDLLLRHLVDEHRQGKLDRLSRDELHEHLKEQAVGLVQVDGLVVFNPDGTPRGVSFLPAAQLPPVNVALQAPFMRLRQDPDPGLWIDAAARNPGTGRWVFPIGRRLSGPGGEFAGVVGAAGRIDYYQEFYRDAHLEAGTHVALVQRDGRLLARHPPADSALGKPIDGASVLLDAARATPNPSRSVSPLEGADRFAAVRFVPDYPLAVIVSRDAEAALASWRVQALGTGLRTLALAALATLLLVALQRQLERLQRAGHSLAVSRERFALAAAGSDDGIWDWDLVSQTAYESARARELQGLPREPETQPLAELQGLLTYHPEDAPRRAAAMQAHLDGHTPAYEVEYRVRHADGEYRWIRVRALCTRDAQGRPLRLAGSVSDIDARKRAEVALRESEQRYALAMTGSREGHWVWYLERHQVFFSATLAGVFGFERKSQVLHDEDYFNRLPLHPDDRERVHRNRNDTIAGVTARLDHEFRIVLPATGEVRWIHTRAQCFRDADGRPQWLAGSTVDVTDRHLAEDALRESRERFEVAVAGADDGIWVWDFARDRAYNSPRGRELAGLPPGPEEAPIAEWNALLATRMHPDDAARRRAAIDDHLAGHTAAYEAEYRVLDPAGHYRWVRVRGMVQRDAQGQPLRMAGSVTDIDARRRIEDALRQSEERYALAVESTADGIYDWDVEADRMYVTERGCRIMGIDGSQRVRPRAEWLALQRIHPDDQALYAAATMRREQGSEPVLEVEYRVGQPDGRWRWIRARGRSVRAADGRALRWVGALTDIDDQKRAEEALRRSEERYQLAVDGSNEGLWDWDLASDMLFLSPRAQQLTFSEVGEPLRRRVEWVARTHYHPDDVAPLRRALVDHLRGRTPQFKAEYRIRHHGGEWHWYRQRGVALRDAGGRAYRMAGSMEDITERKMADAERERLEQQLRQAQKLEAIGTLAGGIAHDFNNILAAILGYGELALKDAPPESRQRRHLDAAMTAGLRAKSLVERILAFSRSGTGERVPVHVHSVLVEALDAVAASLPPGVSLSRRLASGDAGVLGDPTQLHQVVMNLCANAVQAMRSEGRLDVDAEHVTLEAPRSVATSTLPAGEYVRFGVRDTGSGIEPRLLERIFDPFFTTKEVGVGTGLGLSLVHGIVTDLGGGIAVESEVGRGSRFDVYLPARGSVGAPRPADEAPVAGGRGETVLIVDDEEALVRLGEETLAQLGYEPVGFTSATAALEALRETPERFDAVLSDESMPGLTGSEMAAAMRRIAPGLPVVLMSGFVNAALIARARSAGVAEVLAKPLVSREIARALDHALRRSALHSGAK